jgi:hypothetical protein
MLSSRMSLAQNPPPDAWLPAERARHLRESLRSLSPACRQAGLCVIFNTLSAPHRPPMRRPLPTAAAGPLSTAPGGASSCDASCKYSNISDLLIMEHL